MQELHSLQHVFLVADKVSHALVNARWLDVQNVVVAIMTQS
jgi:hypothetical protein